MGYQLEQKITELFSKVEANIPNVMNDIIETGTRNSIIAIVLTLIGIIVCIAFLVKAFKMDEDSSDKVFLTFLSTVILIVLVCLGVTFVSDLLQITFNPDFYIYQQLFQPTR